MEEEGWEDSGLDPQGSVFAPSVGIRFRIPEGFPVMNRYARSAEQR